MKTSELIGPALDWAVLVCEGHSTEDAIMWATDQESPFIPQSSWAQGGPIIERDKIGIQASMEGDWMAFVCGESLDMEYLERGPTPLIAAMRCYCCAKLGDEIEIPQELQPCQQPNL